MARGQDNDTTILIGLKGYEVGRSEEGRRGWQQKHRPGERKEISLLWLGNALRAWRVGNPYENAIMESFFKTLKQEVYL
jgi:hypothetical protein